MGRRAVENRPPPYRSAYLRRDAGKEIPETPNRVWVEWLRKKFLDVLALARLWLRVEFTDISNWLQIGGDSVNSSWATQLRVTAFTVVSGKLYAATGGSVTSSQVWEYDLLTTTWTKVGGDGVNSSWNTVYEFVNCLGELNGKLYAGLGDSNGDAEVWEYDPAGGTWGGAEIGGDGTNSSWADAIFNDVHALQGHDGLLYAAIGGATAGEAEVWAYTPSTTTWAQVGGDGVNSSWNTNYERVFTLAILNSKLYAGIGITADDAEVWEFNLTDTWTKVGGDGVNSSWGTGFEFVEKLAADVTNLQLYAGLGSTADDAEVWEYDQVGVSWTKVMGDGVNSSWGTGYERVTSLAAGDERVYAGLGITTGEAEVWRYNATSASSLQVAGDGVNSSWNTNYEMVSALNILSGVLRAGLGSGAGDGEVWEAQIDAFYLRPNTPRDAVVVGQNVNPKEFEAFHSHTNFLISPDDDYQKFGFVQETLENITGATATASLLIPAGAYDVAVVCEVTEAITGATTWDVGDGTDVDAWGAALALALGTLTSSVNFTVAPGTLFYTSANDVVLTANGANFTDGTVRVTVFYKQASAPEAI